MTTATIKDLAICVLFRGKGFKSQTIYSLEKWGVSAQCDVKIFDNGDQSHDMFTYIKASRELFPDKYVVLIHDDIFFPPRFLQDLVDRINELSAKPWGLIGNAGLSYPFFRPQRCMTDPHGFAWNFTATLPAVQLDGSLIVMNKDFVPQLSAGLKGYHHYDTLLTINSWEQGRPCYTVNAPSFHQSPGSQEGFDASVPVLVEEKAGQYTNPALATLNGPVGLPFKKDAAKVDFYKDHVEATLAKVNGSKDSVDVTIAMRTVGNRPDLLNRALLSIASQKELPNRLKILMASEFKENIPKIQPTLDHYKHFFPVELEVFEDTANNSRVTSLNHYFSISEPGGYTIFLDDDDYIFPNVVSDIRRFTNSMVATKLIGLVFEFYHIHERQEDFPTGKSWVTKSKAVYPEFENLYENMSINSVPFCSFVFPNDYLRESKIDTRLIYFEDYSLILNSISKVSFYKATNKGGIVSIREASDNTVNLEDRRDWDLSLSMIHAEYFFSDFPYLGFAWQESVLKYARHRLLNTLDSRSVRLFIKLKDRVKVLWIVRRLVPNIDHFVMRSKMFWKRFGW